MSHPYLRKLERTLAVLAVCGLAFLAFGATCNGGSRGEDADEQAAVINFRLQVVNGETFANTPYKIEVKWKGELVTGTGSVGDTIPFDVSQSYSGTADANGNYVVTNQANNKMPGTWKLTVATDLLSWSTTCEKKFPAGAITNANFTHSTNGCELGLDFP
jgi:hypothetical protein